MEMATNRQTVNVAVIGTGFMGKEHTKAYALAPVSCPDIAATPVRKILCDSDPTLVAERARQWGYEEYTTDYHEILKRDDIDIVDICAPAHLHVDMAIDAIKAGKFVFCEKPLVTTIEDGERLMEVVKQYNARTATAFNKRRWPAVQYARQLIKEGVIGKVLLYNGRYCQNIVSVRKFARHGTSWKISGGFADSGSHIVDMCRYILDDQYESVVAKAYPLTPLLPARLPLEGEDPATIPMVKSENEDFAMIVAQMKSGVTASLYQSFAYTGAGEDISFEVHGTKGSMRWSGANPSVFQLAVSTGDRNTTGFKNLLMGPGHPYGNCVPRLPGFGVGVADNMAFQAYEVINAYVKGEKYNPSFEDAWEVIRVCEAVRQSEQNKKWIDL